MSKVISYGLRWTGYNGYLLSLADIQFSFVPIESRPRGVACSPCPPWQGGGQAKQQLGDTESSPAVFSECREAALELVCGADFPCNLI